MRAHFWARIEKYCIDFVKQLARRPLGPGKPLLFYRTVMVTVAELGSVSVPPGPKVTVADGLNTAFEVPPAGVTSSVMIIVDGGFAPFFLEPPRDAVVHTNCVPGMPFTVTAVPAAHEPMPPLSTVTLGGFGALMFNPFGVNRVTTTFGAATVVVLLM